jgi:hypothetical protein
VHVGEVVKREASERKNTAHKPTRNFSPFSKTLLYKSQDFSISFKQWAI